jgi:hypothetical protein
MLQTQIIVPLASDVEAEQNGAGDWVPSPCCTLSLSSSLHFVNKIMFNLRHKEAEQCPSL